MTKAPRGFLSDRRGAIAAMTALLATVLIGFGGLAAETAFWYAQKQALQNQADAAALSGAYELLQGNSANAGTWTKNDAVLNGAARSSVNVGSSGCTVTGTSGCCPDSTNTKCKVILTVTQNTTLASAFLPTVTIKAQAEADLNTFTSVACIVALGTGASAVTLAPKVTASNCALAVPNSQDQQSVSISGAGSVNVDTIWSRGGYNVTKSTATLTRPALTFASSSSYMPTDPYTASPPTFPTPSNPQNVGCPSGSLSPGVYNPMSFTTGKNGCKTIDLSPGVFYIMGADATTGLAFEVGNGAKVTCNSCTCPSASSAGRNTGVTIVIYPSSNKAGGISLGGSVTLCAPNTGPTGTTIPAGVLFYQWNSSTANAACNASVTYNPSMISSSGSGSITGVTYLPCGDFTFQKPSGAGASLTCFIAIAKTITATSLTNSSSFSNCTNAGVPTGNGTGIGAQRVYQVVMTQ